MANKPIKSLKSPRTTEEYSWIVYFSLSSWLVLSLFFFTGAYKDFFLSLDKKYKPAEATEYPQIRHVMIDQEKDKPKPKTEEEYFISDKENEASGQLTPKKGFENLSESREMRTPGGDKFELNEKNEKSNQTNSEDEESKILNNQLFAKIVHPLKKVIEKGKSSFFGEKEKPSIPSNYNFNREFAFSWDNLGKPVIPTIYYKHFQYFKNMLDKIQENWSPPGGTPYPVFDNSMNTPALYFPGGSSTYQTFPNQDVQIVFSLDTKGNVLETKIWKSMGYESLNRACIEAINRSGNFGPPPQELLEKEGNIFIMPLTFRIAGSESH